MSRSVNKVTLIGNVGNAPEVKNTNGGTCIATISVATSESWKDKNTGEQKERTEWHRVKAFGRLGEIVGEYVQKGRQVYVEGSLRTEKYTDKNGVEKFSTDVIADEVILLGGGEKQEAAPQRQGGSRTAPKPAANDFDDSSIPF